MVTNDFNSRQSITRKILRIVHQGKFWVDGNSFTNLKSKTTITYQ